LLLGEGKSFMKPILGIGPELVNQDFKN
jgi:hypothetical protein